MSDKEKAKKALELIESAAHSMGNACEALYTLETEFGEFFKVYQTIIQLQSQVWNVAAILKNELEKRLDWEME